MCALFYPLVLFALALQSQLASPAILNPSLQNHNAIFSIVNPSSEDEVENGFENDNESIPNSSFQQFEDYTTPNSSNITSTESYICNLNASLVQEIKGYQAVANQIYRAILAGPFKGRSYEQLSYFVDRFGSRLAGTDNLERAIDYMVEKMVKDGLENVHGEKASIPHWIRGEETAELIFPRKKAIALLGLGYTVGTPAEGITAEVLVVKSFKDLQNKANKAKGKIIVYNEDYTGYGETVKYRGKGASEAAKVGAVASLIRSITPFSIDSPHTGMQSYAENVTQIPTACISIEDAELLQRLQDRGQKLVIHLQMNDTNLPNVYSRNVIGEIVGYQNPEEVVVVSGHIDSWDVGQGAMDDGGGLIISAEALAVVKFLNLRPRRTLRAILWTAEEFGLVGVQEYIKNHENEISNFNAVFESDIGTFRPLGLDFSGSNEASCIIQEVVKLLKPINATTFRELPEVGSDIGYFIEKGVPGLSLNTENSKYFWYHHSEGDTMTVENSDELDLCTAVWTATSYVIADLSVSLPRNG